MLRQSQSHEIDLLAVNVPLNVHRENQPHPIPLAQCQDRSETIELSFICQGFTPK